jgi:Domain of unknown function (DUF4136)
MTRPILLAVAALIWMGLGGCAPSVKVTTDRDPGANLSAYRTFAWVGEHPLIAVRAAQVPSPLLEGRIIRAVRSNLEGRGYRYSENNPDFAIAFTVGSREKIRVDSYPSRYHGNWGWAGTRRYYGGGYTTDTTVRQYTVGALAIDIFDVASRSPVWHGLGEKNITTSDLEDRDALIKLAVDSILAEFP